MLLLSTVNSLFVISDWLLAITYFDLLVLLMNRSTPASCQPLLFEAFSGHDLGADGPARSPYPARLSP